MERRDTGPKPQLEWIELDRLFVDDRYQRSLSTKRSVKLIEKIAAEFYWPSFGVLIVAPAASGGIENKYAIVDGQHRFTVAQHLAKTAPIEFGRVPCCIIAADTVQSQAMAFLSANKDRIVVNHFAVYHAALKAGWPKAMAVGGVCLDADIEIPKYQVPSNLLKPNQTSSVKTIEKAIEQHGTEVTLNGLKAIRMAFPTQYALHAHVIRGVIDCFAFDHRVKLEPAVAALKRITLEGLDEAAEDTRSTEGLSKFQGIRHCLHDALFPKVTAQQPSTPVSRVQSFMGKVNRS